MGLDAGGYTDGGFAKLPVRERRALHDNRRAFGKPLG
jgi:hypothetical protein